MSESHSYSCVCPVSMTHGGSTRMHWNGNSGVRDSDALMKQPILESHTRRVDSKTDTKRVTIPYGAGEHMKREMYITPLTHET